MWNQARSSALDAFIARDSRRSFDDGPLAGLQIQEYWHPDVPPPGSEEEITFYVAATNAFDCLLDFATLVLLFELEDGIVPSARSSFTLDNLAPIASQRFIQQWADCAAKVNGPRLDALDLEASFAVSDEWNDKCYVARDKHKYFAVCWSTTA